MVVILNWFRFCTPRLQMVVIVCNCGGEGFSTTVLGLHIRHEDAQLEPGVVVLLLILTAIPTNGLFQLTSEQIDSLILCNFFFGHGRLICSCSLTEPTVRWPSR